MSELVDQATAARLRTAVIGMGGFANSHLSQLLQGASRQELELVAAIDPDPSRCEHLAELNERAVQIHTSLDDYLRGTAADLVIVSTPIHLHCEHTIKALQHGSHVYCEKPAAARIQDAHAMAKARDQSGRRAAIGYQWSYSDPIRQLKKDIMAGDMGQPRRFRTLVCWPRDASYYGRSSWAGQLQTAAGDWVLDSPVSNATSHYLHNSFFVLGDQPHTSAALADVQAELYRANPITNYDTAALRVHTTAGVEVLYYATHAVSTATGPTMIYEFDDATVTYGLQAGQPFVARFSNGETREYGCPNTGQRYAVCSAAEAIRNNTPLACEIETATPLTLCVNLAQESAREIVDFPKSMIRIDSDTALTSVEGLRSALQECYDHGVLPSDTPAVDWAVAGSVLSAEGYDLFPSRGARN
ncbi:MAG: Gfo/Idh/MocA family oxidoreductase [Verrucomicrobia bacterium]|nr:Gfo/Idh/MocA family oxidoreductase [Verrucomicrobiota bacterium]MDA1086364.1 Gfo/Idh/MocA family oxidoreductase [Verrucomicrobiota bacterium]